MVMLVRSKTSLLWEFPTTLITCLQSSACIINVFPHVADHWFLTSVDEVKTAVRFDCQESCHIHPHRIQYKDPHVPVTVLQPELHTGSQLRLVQKLDDDST